MDESLADEMWAVATQYFPAEILMAKQRDGALRRQEQSVRMNSCANARTNKLSPTAKIVNQHISLLPPISMDPELIPSNHHITSVEKSIQSKLRSLESNLNRFDKLSENRKFDAKLWHESVEARG